MELFVGAFFIVLILAFVFVLATHIIMGIVLTKLNRRMYGYGTAMAWFPILNFYLLGKLTINKYVGWGVIACLFLSVSDSIEVNVGSKTYAILPVGIKIILLSLTNLFILGLFVYAIIKYFKLEKQAVINKQMTMNNQEMQNQFNNQTQVNGLNGQNPVNNQSLVNDLTAQSEVNNQNNNNSNQ